jgi:methylase of polypeptide subunit release factors
MNMTGLFTQVIVVRAIGFNYIGFALKNVTSNVRTWLDITTGSGIQSARLPYEETRC